MSYGITPYGIAPYSGSGSTQLTLTAAEAITPNVVRVCLSKAPQDILPIMPGDVRNPNTWSIVREDTGVGFTIVEVLEADPPLKWDIRVLEPFGSNNVLHTVSSMTLLDEFGGLIDDPREATFIGILSAARATPDRIAASRQFASRDINNPGFPSNPVGGALVITSEGDYQLHEGEDLVRKLIYRRLVTTPGGFFHLPNYGVGVAVKQPLPAGDLVSFQKRIRDQIEQEPEVDTSRVVVRQTGNALTIVVSAVLKPTGQKITLPVELPFAGVAGVAL